MTRKMGAAAGGGECGGNTGAESAAQKKKEDQAYRDFKYRFPMKCMCCARRHKDCPYHDSVDETYAALRGSANQNCGYYASTIPEKGKGA